MKDIIRVKKRLASAITMVGNAITAMDVVCSTYPKTHANKQLAIQTLEMLERVENNINAMRDTLRFELANGEEW